MLSAIRLKDTQTFGKQDPYVVLRCGESEHFRTKVCKDGGTAPTWNEKFTFTIARGENEVHLRIWNSNMLRSDTCIGSAVVELDKVFKEGYDDVDVSVFDAKGRPAGVLNVVLTFMPGQVSKPTQPAPSAQPSVPSVQPSAPSVQQILQMPQIQAQIQAQQAQANPRQTNGGAYFQQQTHPGPRQTIVIDTRPPNAPARPPAYVPKPIGGGISGSSTPVGPGPILPPPPGWAPPSAPARRKDDIWG